MSARAQHRITVAIDRLIVNGLTPADSRMFVRDVREALARLLARQGPVGAFGETRRIDSFSPRAQLASGPDTSAPSLGAQAAAHIVRRITS